MSNPFAEFSGRRRFLQHVLTSAASATGLLPVFADGPACIGTDELFHLPNGCRIGYRRFGNANGLPVLYFHGNPSCRLEVELVADDAWRNRVQIVAIDRPGIGSSSYFPCHTESRWPHYVEPLIDHLLLTSQYDKCGLIGFSTGTVYALACAAHLPNKIGAVVILGPRSPGAPYVPEGTLDKAVSQLEKYPRIARFVLSQSVRKVRRDRGPMVGSELLAPVDRQIMESNRPLLRSVFLEAARCGVKGLIQDATSLQWPWCIDLSAISMPVALWFGSCDWGAPPNTILAERIPTSSMLVYQGDGHLSLLRYRFADAIEWIESQME